MYYPTNVDRILQITDRDRQKRIQKIMSMITRPYRIQHTTVNRLDVMNIIVPAKKQKGKIVLVAHHDIFPGSVGYNDNSTGVITLLRLQDYLPDDIELVFTDREENSGRGCRAYLEHEIKCNRAPSMAVNVDVVGLGETIFGAHYGNTSRINLNETRIEFIDYIPFSDSYILEEYGIPNILLVTGKEKNSLITNIFDAQHNGKNDGRLDLISETVLNKVFETLKILIKNNTGSGCYGKTQDKNDRIQGNRTADKNYKQLNKKATLSQ